MIISMRLHATREEIDHVCERIREFGYKVHSIEGEERVRDRRGRNVATSPLPGVAGSDAVRGKGRAHLGALQVRQQRVQEGAHSYQGERRLHRRRRVHRHGRPLLGRNRKADHGDGRGRGRSRSARSCAAAHSSRAPRPTIFRAWKRKASNSCAKPSEPRASRSSPK